MRPESHPGVRPRGDGAPRRRTYSEDVFGRLRAWRQRHQRLLDVLTLAPLALLSLATADRLTPWPAAIVLTAAMFLPLLWRRSHPREVFAIIALVCFVQWLAGVMAFPGNFAILIALYSVAAQCAGLWSVAAWLICEFGLVLVIYSARPSPWSAFITSSVFVSSIWLAGLYANTRRRYVESLVERAERAERERDQQARIAAAAERARIARELHDVVAHNVSVMIVQADGAAYAIDTDPEQARLAMQAVARTGRQALAEMRRLVGVLRQDAGNPAEEYAPQPGIDQLTDLIKQVNDSGLPVEFTVDGTPQDLPEGKQLAIYRIIQEALTNTLKHGGPGARATVEVTYGADEIVLRITDDGRGAAAPQAEGGHGLIGMRERAAMYGGTVTAGPRPGGGFQVVARFPVGGQE